MLNNFFLHNDCKVLYCIYIQYSYGMLAFEHELRPRFFLHHCRVSIILARFAFGRRRERRSASRSLPYRRGNGTSQAASRWRYVPVYSRNVERYMKCELLWQLNEQLLLLEEFDCAMVRWSFFFIKLNNHIQHSVLRVCKTMFISNRIFI